MVHVPDAFVAAGAGPAVLASALALGGIELAVLAVLRLHVALCTVGTLPRSNALAPARFGVDYAVAWRAFAVRPFRVTHWTREERERVRVFVRARSRTRREAI